jgi:DNA-binding transcriptional LysR family regulator
MLAYWDVHEHLAAGSLVAIALQDAAMEDLSVWAVMPTRRYVPARAKVFLEALEQELAKLQQEVRLPDGMASAIGIRRALREPG